MTLELSTLRRCAFFLTTVEGNLLTENQQWAKLKLVVDIARRVWS